MQIYVWDLNNIGDPFLLGNRTSRADDLNTVDWNKKIPHILVTGGSGGFVTVWDVKTKRESLTLSTLGRKAVSAVAWHPENVRSEFLSLRDHRVTNFVLSGYEVNYCYSGRKQPGDLSLGFAKLECARKGLSPISF